MNQRTDIWNLIILFIVMIVALAIGVFAYNSPKTIMVVADTIITSISIIFGLSLSLITLASGHVKVSEGAVPRAETRRGIEIDLEWENSRTILRQKLSVIVLILSIVLGIVFIALSDFAPNSIVFFLTGAVFSFFTTLSFAISFILPFSISNTIRRNRYFQSSGDL
jgi:hypothetical protein